MPRGGGGGGGGGGEGGAMSARLDKLRSYTTVGKDLQTGCHPLTSSGSMASVGIDNTLDLERFAATCEVRVVRLEGDTLEFDLIGVDASFANALRRVLIAEVPTMAIEQVYIGDNTSVIPDEVLSHRLGLVPLHIDPRRFEFVERKGEYNEDNSVMFKLNKRIPGAAKGSEAASVNHSLKSGELEWRPDGSEWPPGEAPEKRFTQFAATQNAEADGADPAPTSKEILLAKMRAGQVIELEALAVKGQGKDHAKFSPVATAFYRLLPHVEIVRDVFDEDADKLVRDGDEGLFGTETLPDGRRRAVVLDPRKCTMSRNCLREEPGESCVAMHQKKDHFIFSVESTGALPPDVLVTEALKIIAGKAKDVREGLAQ